MYHVAEHWSLGLPLRSVCFLGYNADVDAVGWTHSGGNMSENEMLRIREESITEYMTSNNGREIAATAFGFAVGLGSLIILLRNAV